MGVATAHGFSTEYNLQAEAKELGQGLLAAVDPDQAASASATPTGEPSGSATPAAAPTSTTTSASVDSIKANLVSTADRLLKELAGVPIPSAPGQIVGLGSVR